MVRVAPAKWRWAPCCASSARSTKRKRRSCTRRWSPRSRTGPARSPAAWCRAARRGSSLMRALQCVALGKPSDLKVVDLPDPPTPKAGEIKVAVATAGLNFADTLMISGQYQTKPDLPFVPGLELAGTVIEVGPGETRLKP